MVQAPARALQLEFPALVDDVHGALRPVWVLLPPPPPDPFRGVEAEPDLLAAGLLVASRARLLAPHVPALHPILYIPRPVLTRSPTGLVPTKKGADGT